MKPGKVLCCRLVFAILGVESAESAKTTGLPGYVCVVTAQHVHMNIHFPSIIAIVNI